MIESHPLELRTLTHTVTNYITHKHSFPNCDAHIRLMLHQATFISRDITNTIKVYTTT